MYAVTGSTSQIGSAVVRALLAEGKQVRALFRTTEKADALAKLGTEPFQAPIEDGSRMEAAFQAMEGVFIMTPPFRSAPGPRGEHAMALAAITHAVQASHVPKVVFLSALGSEHAEGTGSTLRLYDMEQSLGDLAMNTASIRAAYVMEDLQLLYPKVGESGELLSLFDSLDKPVPLVASEDIGKLAARLLIEPWEGHRTIELEGPCAYSMEEIARSFSEALGRPVQALPTSEAERLAALESLNYSPRAAQDTAEMFKAIHDGVISFTGDGSVEHVQGETPLESVLKAR